MEVMGVQILNDYVHLVSLLKYLSLVMKASVSDIDK